MCKQEIYSAIYRYTKPAKTPPKNGPIRKISKFVVLMWEKLNKIGTAPTAGLNAPPEIGPPTNAAAISVKPIAMPKY